MAVYKLDKLSSELSNDSNRISNQSGFAPSKDKRHAFFLNHSKHVSSIRAVKEAKLIKNLKPSDVRIIKICG